MAKLYQEYPPQRDRYQPQDGLSIYHQQVDQPGELEVHRQGAQGDRLLNGLQPHYVEAQSHCPMSSR